MEGNVTNKHSESRKYLSYCYLYHGLKGTIVNRACHTYLKSLKTIIEISSFFSIKNATDGRGFTKKDT